MRRIPSPYNFVPQADRVVLPDWGELISHDVPFRDGISGSFDVELEAHTPILCRGQDPGGSGDEAHFFKRKSDGRYAIQGTSVRGMLRNVVEIAGFGRLDRVAHDFHAIRDLHNRFTYGQYMSDIRGRQPVPLVNAGWLRVKEPTTAGSVDHAEWVIEPCHFAKVEYERITPHGPRGYNPGRKQSAVDKYYRWCGLESPRRSEQIGDLGQEAWARIERPRDFSVQVLLRGGQPHEPGRLSDFGVVGFGQNVSGQLVFTGQPSEHPPRRPPRHASGRPKHHDFLFYGQAGRTLSLDDRAKAKFLGAHRDSGQQGRRAIEPNAEWRFWRRRLRMGGRVPVFFLMHPDRPGELWAIGLAMMFRLAYDNSPQDLARAVHAKAWDDPRPDLGDALFGHVLPRDKRAPFRGRRPLHALRGRVSIGDAVVVAEQQPQPEQAIKVVLSVPKPSFYPNYLVQGSRPGGRPPSSRSGPKWSTYMNHEDGSKPRLRGWKRYAARKTINRDPALPANVRSDSSIFTYLRPLPAGTRFKATIRVHNLRPAELGALLWALDFGGTPGARHQLGQGRPLGLGNCTLCPVSFRLQKNTGETVDDPAPTVADFVGFMDHALGTSWADTEQVRALVGLATPEAVADEDEHYRYPELGRPNEFVEAKKAALSLEAPRRSQPPLLAGTPHAPTPATRSLWVPTGNATPGAPSAGSPEETSAPVDLPTELRVRFADQQQAIQRRRIFVKQAAKKKIKPFHLPVIPIDPAQRDHPDLAAGLVVSTTETDGIVAVFRALADHAGGLFEFVVIREPESPVCPNALVTD